MGNRGNEDSKKAVLFLQKKNQKNACFIGPQGLQGLGVKESEVFLLRFACLPPIALPLPE
jgi:hypothetical protein